jgi:membrane associated rhomboid family serine protease
VAWYAHIGGFLGGVLLIRFFAVRVKRRVVAIDPYHL